MVGISSHFFLKKSLAALGVCIFFGLLFMCIVVGNTSCLRMIVFKRQEIGITYDSIQKTRDWDYV